MILLIIFKILKHNVLINTLCAAASICGSHCMQPVDKKCVYKTQQECPTSVHAARNVLIYCLLVSDNETYKGYDYWNNTKPDFSVRGQYSSVSTK